MGLKEMYVPIFLIPFGFVDSPPFDLKSALYAKQSLLLGNRLNVNSSKGCKHTSRYFRFLKSTSKPFDEKLILKASWILFNQIWQLNKIHQIYLIYIFQFAQLQSDHLFAHYAQLPCALLISMQKRSPRAADEGARSANPLYNHNAQASSTADGGQPPQNSLNLHSVNMCWKHHRGHEYVVLLSAVPVRKMFS